MRRIVCLFVIFLFSCVTIHAQTDTLLSVDLRNNWRMVTDDGIVPFVELSDFQGKMLFVPVELENYRGGLLRISSEQSLSLFHNKQLLEILPRERWMPIDSLIRIHGSRVTYTLYEDELNPRVVHTGIYRIANLNADERTPISIEGRNEGVRSNVWTFTFFFILIYIGVLYYFFPRSLREFFWVTRAISFRELDENLIKTRPLARGNIGFYVLLAFISAWVIEVLLVLTDNPLGIAYFSFNDFWMGVWAWFRFAVIIFGLLIGKFVLIWVFKELFRIKAFINSHYYNYIRLGLLFYVILALIIFVSYFTLFEGESSYYSNLMVVLVIMLILRMVILFFKLMNSSSHSVLHLFSYLCATELIPLLLIVSVGFNQMM